MPNGPEFSTQPSYSSMEIILTAQEGRLGHFPSYHEARREIEQGRKMSCWMWYIWPSLRAIRQHRMPSMLLKDFQEAQKYLRHDILGARLVEMTRLANVHLEHGVSLEWLFGSIDAVKFHETCTLFAAVAVANKSPDASVFTDALVLLGGMNRQAVVGLQDEKEHVRKVSSLVNGKIEALVPETNNEEKVQRGSKHLPKIYRRSRSM